MVKYNAGFEIILSIPLDDGIPEHCIAIGRRKTSFGVDYCTWEHSRNGEFYWGHYDFQSFAAAIKDAYRRTLRILGGGIR